MSKNKLIKKFIKAKELYLAALSKIEDNKHHLDPNEVTSYVHEVILHEQITVETLQD
ncbi:hypothetical protein [Candidatus Izimaplasma sp. ZiA1]|uniref:hypothetical protein n=1 Tax=Candidatus Izimoplasma sp. ZiA1 TaxID=2024899 RepID=UPI00143B3DC0